MLEVFPQPEKWDLLNNKLKNELKSDQSVRAYVNPYLATYDLVIGLSQLFSHKRSIAWIKGLSPLFDSVYSYFVREGYHIQTYTLEEFQKEAIDLLKFVDQLKKDTLFFFYAEDNPLTGELYDFENLENILSHKKIFSISVSHQNVISRSKSFYPLSSRICWQDEDLTLVYLGEKLKVNSIVGYFQNFGFKNDLFFNDLFLKNKFKNFHHRQTFKKEILHFENSFVENNMIHSDQRIWDRSLLKFSEVHSDELAYRLKELGFNNVFSLSVCSFGSVKMFHKGLSSEYLKTDLNHLILFSFKELSDFPSAEQIKTCIEEIKSSSSWVF